MRWIHLKDMGTEAVTVAVDQGISAVTGYLRETPGIGLACRAAGAPVPGAQHGVEFYITESTTRNDQSGTDLPAVRAVLACAMLRMPMGWTAMICARRGLLTVPATLFAALVSIGFTFCVTGLFARRLRSAWEEIPR